MWLDNASEVDILFYEPYANVIADISKNPSYKPLTIGVFGVWGAGKSTLLKLIEQKINVDSENKGKTLCININAWTFEGYEDAKIALMEALLREINDHKDTPSKVKEDVSTLLKKLDFFKLATKAASVGAPIIASVATGNPIPLMLSVSGKAEEVGDGIKNVANAMQSIRDDYLKNEKSDDANSIVNNVRKFRQEFKDALKDDDIENVVVLIDDLDRCQPDRIIETLEAIKLFLSVEKMTFIIAADENVIQYAIRKKYPPIENYSVNLDKEYIEKIIQLPIYIPELSSKDIENYLMLLVVQEYCNISKFNEFLKKIKEEKLLISNDAINVQKIKRIAKDYINQIDRQEFDETVNIIAGIKRIIAGNLKGNPRQAKRFLNTYITKKKLAELYFGTDEDALDTRVLAKLLVLQKLDGDLFIQLNEWNKKFTTENEEFKAMLDSIESDDSENEKYKAWNVPTIINWVESEPKNLSKIRLDRYFYLTRESLKKADVDVSMLSSAVKDILERIGKATRGLIDLIVQDMKKLSPSDQSMVFEVIIPKIQKGEIEFFIIRSLFVGFEAYRSKICTALESYSKKITIKSVSAIKEMRSSDKMKVDSLIATWEKAGIIDQEMIETIKKEKKDGNF